MAFKKRIKSKVIDNTQVNVTSEYSRKHKGKKRVCSLVINGLLMASMLLNMTTPSFANTVSETNSEVANNYSNVVENNKEEIDKIIEDIVSEKTETEKELGVDATSGAYSYDSRELTAVFNTSGAFTEFKNQQLNRATANSSVSQVKLAGSDRYKTAVEISKAGWSTATKALIVNGTALPDALCASPLADEYNAPILLTQKDKLNGDTLTELKRLGVKEVTLIGSEGVISKSQEDQLKQQGFSVERIGGIDRYETSLKIANKLKGIYQAKGNTGRKTVFLANGVKGLADATSVSSPAGIKDGVILYTNGSNLNGVKYYIETSTDDVYLIGGTSVISTAVENELKNTTNKRIVRLAGATRNETNAKVINEFFPDKTKATNVYVAKDGMGDDNQLVDGLAVGSLASKNNAPVILSSSNLDATQKTTLQGRNVSKLVQVGEGGNETATRQAMGIITANATTEDEANKGNSSTSDIKLPTLTYAQEKSMAMSGSGGYNAVKENVIQGTIYVKYGNPNTRPHSYGSKNQAEYDYVVNYVKGVIKNIDFRLCSNWVYTQYYLNGGRDENYIDPILAKNGLDIPYRSWAANNKYLIIGLEKGIVSKADAEKLAIYNSALSIVVSSIGKTTDPLDGSPYSAYDAIYRKKSDCDSSAMVASIVGDVLGYSTMVGGTTTHQDCRVKVGNYWWTNGRTPGLNATDNVFQKTTLVLEAPTY